MLTKKLLLVAIIRIILVAYLKILSENTCYSFNSHSDSIKMILIVL